MKFTITKKQSTNLLLTLMSAAAITACGGGSGGSDTAEANNSAAVAEASQDGAAGASQNEAPGDLVVASNPETSDGDEAVASADTDSTVAGDATDPVLAATMASATGATVSENFEGTTTSFGNALIAHKNIDLASGQGVGGGKAIKVKYVGNSQGSERVLVNFKIPKAKVYTLNFDVKFCSGFDWARGGKLHGLGPLKPITGGNSVPSTGWSARGMFNDNGTFKSYVYSQNMKGQYGDEVSAGSFKFQAGRYHAVTYQVGLNDPASQSNGYLKVFVDGKQIVNHTGIKFRGSSADETLIQTLLFNTFHGGSDSSWAPRTASGAYKTDCAYYDNFAAYPFARVRTAPGL